MCCIFENTRWTETGTRAKTRRRATYLSLRGVWNFNKYLAQACQNRQRRERLIERETGGTETKKQERDRMFVWCLSKGWSVIKKIENRTNRPDVTKMRIQQRHNPFLGNMKKIAFNSNFNTASYCSLIHKLLQYCVFFMLKLISLIFINIIHIMKYLNSSVSH